MPWFYRIVRERYAATPFDGEGAARSGGRWNPRGRRAVYLSATLSLAALEVLVHLQSGAPGAFVAWRCHVLRASIRRIRRRELPRDWNVEPVAVSTQRIGEGFLREGRWLGLLVPRAVIPTEFNLILNPTHPEAGTLRRGDPVPFAFDPRLLA